MLLDCYQVILPGDGNCGSAQKLIDGIFYCVTISWRLTMAALATAWRSAVAPSTAAFRNPSGTLPLVLRSFSRN